MHVSYSSILVGAVGLSLYYAGPVQCRGFRKFGGGGGGGGELGQFSKFKGGVEEFSGSRGMRIYMGLANFQDPGGSDNNIFQGGSYPR